ncbi:unnamed protein product [marine sediment metagenome]|uniref:Uncharacterized protein n=1 Tax=marine sediment metagenome TaxID=412755 RepID=X1LAT4_9ZZZZ
MPISNPASGWPTTFLQLSDTPPAYVANKSLRVNPGGGAVEFGALPTSGTYTGDSNVNRAIPHGLGVIPKLVLIVDQSNEKWWHRIVDSDNGSIYNIDLVAGKGVRTFIIVMTTTNFYVGAAITPQETANLDTDVYHWIAIG